jgi:hypothetical protein
MTQKPLAAKKKPQAKRSGNEAQRIARAVAQPLPVGKLHRTKKNFARKKGR